MTKPKGELKTIYSFLKEKGGERILDTLQNSMCNVKPPKHKKTGRKNRRSIEASQDPTQKHPSNTKRMSSRGNNTAKNNVITTSLKAMNTTLTHINTPLNIIKITRNSEKEKLTSENNVGEKFFNLKNHVLKESHDDDTTENDDDVKDEYDEDENDADKKDDSDKDQEVDNDNNSDEKLDGKQEVHKENYECYVINKWRYKIEQKLVNVVESKCHDTMELLGYKLTNSDMTVIRNMGETLIERQYKIKPSS